MRILSLAISFLIVTLSGWTQDSPHGSELKISCSKCHSPESWDLDREIYSFDHNSTNLPLEGQHVAINCRMCHPTLVFSEAETDCFSCHTDMHSQTVGNDCARCHTPQSWIVENIADVHRQSRFPLQGPHYLATCLDCHLSAAQLRFEPLGVECMDCHTQDYQSATNPDHVLGNFSTDCIECHSMNTFEWGGSGFNHTFFPLTQGHEVYDCKQCHDGSDYANISAECVSCHQEDYNSTTNPNHLTVDFSTDCMECHTTLPEWKPALYEHDAFPLNQGHTGIDCMQCHDPADYSNISAECVSCHLDDYNNTTNPSHIGANISTDCMECHTTLPGWKPAEIRIHDTQFFPIYSGKHAGEWADCATCHSNPSNYSVFSCFECHEHNQTSMDDKHSGEPGYIYTSTACLDCHPQGTHE